MGPIAENSRLIEGKAPKLAENSFAFDCPTDEDAEVRAEKLLGAVPAVEV